MNDENTPPRSKTEIVSEPNEDRRRIWASTELLGDQNEAIILHAGETYRLRRTKQGKLILYK